MLQLHSSDCELMRCDGIGEAVKYCAGRLFLGLTRGGICGFGLVIPSSDADTQVLLGTTGHVLRGPNIAQTSKVGLGVTWGNVSTL